MSLHAIVERFRGRRVAVLGDLGADCYVDTRPMRLSREAPVMILRYEGRRFGPGCAANTVMNLHTLGAQAIPIGIVGEDEAGAALLACFREEGIPTGGVVVGGSSLVKVRVMSGDVSRLKQQVLRVDMEPDGAFPPEARRELESRAGLAEGVEGIIVSDYGYGSASPGLLAALREHAPAALVSVDSRSLAGAFPGADLLTPNEWEAATVLRREVETDEQAAAAARDLRALTGAGAVLLTRGNHGMMLFDGALHEIPISGSSEIVDPSGAGDTVVATATLARCAGAGYLEAARLANFAAGVTVMKSGAAPLSPEELLQAVDRG